MSARLVFPDRQLIFQRLFYQHIIYVLHLHIPGHRRALDPLKLESHGATTWMLGTEPGPLQESVLKNTEPSLQPRQ